MRDRQGDGERGRIDVGDADRIAVAGGEREARILVDRSALPGTLFTGASLTAVTLKVIVLGDLVGIDAAAAVPPLSRTWKVKVE